MNIEAKASVLSGALSQAAMAAASSKKTDALVHVVADAGAISFSCSGLGIAIKAMVEVKVDQPGAAVVSAVRLTGLVAGFPAGTTISFSGTTNALTIAGGAASYRLPIYPDAPDTLAIDSEIASISMAGADLLTLLDVSPAANTEQTRLYLNGIFLHNDADRIVAVATDGTKLLRDSVVAPHFSSDPERRLIVPAKAASLLQKLIWKTQQVTLRRSQNLFAVKAPSFEFVTRLVDATYPDISRVLPKQTPNSLTCARADLIAALARLAAVADRELSPLIALSWTAGEPLRVFLPRQPGDADDLVSAEAEGRGRIALSLPQLAAMIANFDCARIRLAADGDGPLSLHQGDDDKLGVLMGVRWNFGMPLSSRLRAVDEKVRNSTTTERRPKQKQREANLKN